ncbi:DUF6689 family protein [Luteimonas terricola]|uniref:Uncharacterized protein n=1 Tax=Luteimonas terricola TaxID=645597 RepID=A0ABQ2EDM0_9GAMM|nr:DUF6689 family protein [Luteimonas terricola]GGK03483.1 hypothetical protein GCM10011394_10670 [Luteimonas terricola]
MAALLFGSGQVAAQSIAVPVQVDVSGNTAVVQIGSGSQPLAELILTFDDASGLSASSLGVSAQLVNINDPTLLTRLPGQTLTPLDPALPLMITVEPPALGGLSFNRTVRAEVHTHALPYTAGSSLRLLKAPLNGAFRDITDEIAPGSVRARGTTGGFSQFLVVTDLRETGVVLDQKFSWLRARIAALPSSEQAAFDAYLDAAESAVASGDHAGAIGALDEIRARASARAGLALTQQWRATRDVENQAGEIIAGAATLRYSVAYLRDYGR